MLTLAVAALGGFTAYLDSLIGQLTAQTGSQMKSVRAGLDAVNAAINAMKQTLEENGRTLQVHQGLLARALAESRASALLTTVDSYLGQLEANGELEFEGAEDRADTSRKLKDRIRPAIVNQILQNQDITDGQVRRRIERLVDRDLDDF